MNNIKNVIGIFDLTRQFKIEDIDLALIHNFLDNLDIKIVKNKNLHKYINTKTKNSILVSEIVHKKGIKITLDLLLKYYELQVDDNDKKINGSYYTPSNIINYILDEIIQTPDKILDPACGSGAFLLEAAIKFKKLNGNKYKEIFKKYIFGIDIIPINVERTKLLLSLLAISSGEDELEFDFNIITGDSLTYKTKVQLGVNSKFKYIVGNPPYVRTKNISNTTRIAMENWDTASLGNTDLYIPFFEMALSLLTDDGILGYITPNTYLTSLNAGLLRNMLKRGRNVKKIVDFDGLTIFQGVSSYTCISIITKAINSNIQFVLVDSYEQIDFLLKLKPITIDYESLGNNEWRLLPKTDLININKIESIGIPLYKYAKRMITGIATLNNKAYLIDGNKKNGNFYIKKYKNKNYLIEANITKVIIKPNKIKSHLSLKKNKERIIYPYFVDNGSAKLISSADLKKLYPNTYDYFLDIKNELQKRDTSLSELEWYAYGRSQALNTYGSKIIFPMMANKPSFVYVKQEDTLIYCGYAIFLDDQDSVNYIIKILNSSIMWYYIKKTSKNYSGGFKSFAKNYVKNFSIPKLSEKQKKLLLSLSSEKTNNYLSEIYELTDFSDEYLSTL